MKKIQIDDCICHSRIKNHFKIKNDILSEIDKNKDILKNSPHTAKVVSSDKWVYNYSREEADIQ